MNQPIETPQEGIDIKLIFQALSDGRWLIAFAILVSGAIGIGQATISAPIYSGNALLQIEAKASGFAGLTDLADVFGGGESATTTELELLKSRRVMQPTVTKFNLEIFAEPEHFPVIGEYFYRKHNAVTQFGKPLFAEYFDYTKNFAWGGEKIEVSVFNTPISLLNAKFRIVILPDDKYELVLNKRTLFQGTVGELSHIADYEIDLRVDKLSGRIGTNFILIRRDLVSVINGLVSRLEVSENGKTSGIVRLSMNGPDRSEIERIINDVLTTYQAQNAEHNSDEVGESLKFVEQELPKATAKMEEAEDNIYQYRLTNKTINLSLKTQQLLTRSLRIEDDINRLALEEPELTRKFKPQHPLFLEFNRKKQDLLAKQADIEAKTSIIPTEQFYIYKLERAVQLSQKIYLQTLNRVEELKIIRAGSQGSIRIIDQTIVLPGPIGPNRTNIVMVAVIIGLVAASAIILLRMLMDKSIKSINALKKTGLKIFAVIPTSKNQKKLNKLKDKRGEMRILSELLPNDPAVAALHDLHNGLKFSLKDKEKFVLMITSDNQHSDSHFVAQNLATILARTGKKTLIVDAHMRNGSQHISFGMDSKPGLTDFLSDDAILSDICRETRIKNLDILSCGRTVLNPTELLHGTRLTELCAIDDSRYDCIIIDTPTILNVADAGIIGGFANNVIIVVKQDISQIEQIEQTEEKLTIAGVEISGYVYIES